MNTSPVTLAELARATEDLPLETPAEAEGRDPLAPSPEDIATLTTQYRKAVNGLYEAYLFGQMLAQVKARLEQFTGDATRGTARELTQTGANGGTLAAPGWNAGTGLKAWLAQHCPEINYSTARRFLAVAEKTNAALALETQASGEDAASPAAGHPSLYPSEETVRAFLAGKSQRSLLRGGARAGAGRTVKDAAEALDRDGKLTWSSIEGHLAALNHILVEGRRHCNLNADDLALLRNALHTLCNAVED